MIPVFSGKIQQGRLSVNSPSWQPWLDSLEGHRVEVVVRRPRRKRSLQAERYYRKVLLKLAVEALALTPAEAHVVLKQLFLAPYGMESVTDMDYIDNGMEFQKEFIENVIWFLAEMGYPAPPATKVWA